MGSSGLDVDERAVAEKVAAVGVLLAVPTEDEEPRACPRDRLSAAWAQPRDRDETGLLESR